MRRPFHKALTLTVCEPNNGETAKCEQEHAEPFDVAKHLSISEEFGKVDVKNVARMFDHDVVIVSITDAEDICSHAVASTACCEVIYSLHKAQQYCDQHVCLSVGLSVCL